MPITVTADGTEFHLHNRQLSYIFGVLKNGQLGQLYYGKPLRPRASFAHLGQIERRSNTVQYFDDDSAFSPALIRHEYPMFGCGDFRYPAFDVRLENGSRITNFTFHGYHITKGKAKLPGLPATHAAGAAEATTLDILLIDTAIQADLHLYYTIFEQAGAIARSARFVNRGSYPLVLASALSASIDLPDADYVMVQTSGSWARERHLHERPLVPGVQSISSTRYASSPQHNPLLVLRRPETTETSGSVYGFSLIYSGNFLAQAEVDDYRVCRVSIGINPFGFSWHLAPGADFQTPEALFVYSDKGLTGMSFSFYDICRHHLMCGKWSQRERPILLNTWEALHFHYDDASVMALAESASRLGIELFVLDDGWFGRRDSDKSSLGDWFTNFKKFPRGITSLAERIRALGLRFGLWIEPEMISQDSDLYRAHPDWMIRTPGRRASMARHQYVLDCSRQVIIDYLYGRIAALIRAAKLAYVKWDMNRYITEAYSATLPSDRQAELGHRYMLGVYQLFDRLTRHFPDILFESCASGGGRFDFGMLHYTPQIWTSDDTDAIERLSIQFGSSLAYPPVAMGAHVSAVPNKQTGRLAPLETRAAVAYFGAFGYELDVTALSPEDELAIKRQILFYKANRRLIQFGDFYRLESPYAATGNIISWMVVSPDQKEALAMRVQVLNHPNPPLARLYFRGLRADFPYKLSNCSDILYGDELMNAGVLLRKPKSTSLGQSLDFFSWMIRLKAAVSD
ncbi:MAG: alpha-galactosidase [Sporolactobacillus sp.]